MPGRFKLAPGRLGNTTAGPLVNDLDRLDQGIAEAAVIGRLVVAENPNVAQSGFDLTG